MPRFKATPLQCFRERVLSSDDEDTESQEPIIINPRDIEGEEKTEHHEDGSKVEQSEKDFNSVEDSDTDEEDEEESSEEEWCPSQKDAKKRRLLRASAKPHNGASKISRTNVKQNNVPISVPNSSANLDSIQTATFLAQAAAVATVAALTSGGPLLPLFPSNGPPIAPLGLSLPSLPPTSESENTEANQKQIQANETLSKSLSALVSSIQSGGLLLPPDGSKINEDALSMLNGQASPPKPPIREKDFTNCPVCDKRMRRGSLREHMDRHANSGRFQCPICSKNFSRESAREKHVRTHTGERPYKCQFCSRAYKQKVHLNEHMRSHTGARPFICRLCGFSSASKSLLNRHLRTHGIRKTLNDSADMWMKTDAPTEEVLKAAGEVGRVLIAKRNVDDGSKKPDLPLNLPPLIDPNDLATLSRKYLCTVCPAGFPTVQALRSHRLLTHNLVNPHKCPNCSEAFSSVKLLKVHLRKSHPQMCPICSQQMTERRRWLLEVHLRDEHPEVSVVDLLGPSPFTKGCPKSNSSNNNSSNGSTTKKRKRKPRKRSEYSKWNTFKPEKPDSSSSDNDDGESESETLDSEIEDAEYQCENERSTETNESVQSNSKEADANSQPELKDTEKDEKKIEPDQSEDVCEAGGVANHNEPDVEMETQDKPGSPNQAFEVMEEEDQIQNELLEQIGSSKSSNECSDAVESNQT